MRVFLFYLFVIFICVDWFNLLFHYVQFCFLSVGFSYFIFTRRKVCCTFTWHYFVEFCCSNLCIVHRIGSLDLMFFLGGTSGRTCLHASFHIMCESDFVIKSFVWHECFSLKMWFSLCFDTRLKLCSNSCFSMSVSMINHSFGLNSVLRILS